MMKPGDPKYRYLYAFWAFLECLVFGGLIYGWGSLVYVLKDEGLYLDLCDNETDATTASNISENGSYTVDDGTSAASPSTNSCNDRDAKLALVFTIASSVFCVGSFVMGQISFTFGTRITRLIATVLFIIGSLLIAFTNNEIPWLVFPGLCCLAIGGVTYLMTNTQISLLFPAGDKAVIGLIFAGYDASSGVQLLVKIGHENGVTRQTSFIILACIHLFTLVSTFLFLPKDFIEKPERKYSPRDLVVDDDANTIELVADKVKDEEEHQRKVPTLKSSLTSPYYILHVFWVSILQLRFYFFLSSLNPVLDKMFTDNEVSHYTNIFMYILICGIFTSPLAGFVYDKQKHLFKCTGSQLYSSLMPSVIPLVVTTVLAILWSGLMLVEDPRMLYAVFVLVLLFRSFLYTIGTAFISSLFPIEHFGILYGLLLMCAAVVSALQYVLYSWAESTSFKQINLILLVLMLVTFIHPLFMWRRCWSAKRAGNVN